MFGRYQNICIRGIASAVPQRRVNNFELVESLGSKRTKRQVILTGIEARHICDKGQSASDLVTVAAQKLMEQLQWDRNDVRVLVFVTQSPDVSTPSTAMIIQKRLNIGEDCLAFDVNLGCTGYVSGLQIISGLLSNIGGKGLLLVGDGRYYDQECEINGNTLLFGDGAAATAVERMEGKGFSYFQKTDGKRHNVITRSLSGDVYMDGNAVLLFSLGEVANSIQDTKSHFCIEECSIDYYVLHQAQRLIIDGIANECGIDSKKILTSYQEYGNTSTATLPITICHNSEKIKEKKTVNMFLSGFGVGLAWSNVYIELDTENILPVISTNYCFGE